MSEQVKYVYECTPAQEAVIRSNRYKYVWRIVYSDGQILDQLDKDGVEQKIDFLRPMSEVSWLAASPGLPSATITLRQDEQIVIARRTMMMMNGSTFIGSYIIGKQHLMQDGSLRRNVCFISPPAEGLVLRAGKQEVLQFPGEIEETQGDYAEFISAAQRWVAETKPLVVA